MKIPTIQKLFFQPAEGVFVEFFRYTFVGAVAFAVDFSLLYIFTEYLGIYYLISAIISFVAGLTVNYYLSKKWVFSKQKIRNRAFEFGIFAFIGIVGLSLNELFLWLFTEKASVHYLWSKVLTVIVVYLWNFTVRKIILFR